MQLVAAATMFISSKLVDPCPISGNDLVKYTDKTYNLTELLVSNYSVSPAKYFNYFLCKIPLISCSFPSKFEQKILRNHCCYTLKYFGKAPFLKSHG